MTTYRELYFYLFGKIAEATEELERGEVVLAIQHLIMAQQEAEDRALEADILPETCVCGLQDFCQTPPHKPGAV